MEEAVLASAAEALAWWRHTPPAERSRRLTALAGVLSQNALSLQRLITEEVSKTVRSSAAEVVKCAAYVRWLAENAPSILAPRRVGSDATIHYEPLGVVAGIMPWNFPLWQVIRFAATALAAGNTVVVKHSPLVPRSAEALTRLFAVAGFGEGLFYCRSGCSREAESLIVDERVRAVTFTGGPEAGRAVAALAGRHLKRCTLELGGSDAFVVMPSADLGRAVRNAVQSRIRAGGQACTAAKRFLVHEAVAAEFEDEMVRATRVLKTGDPFDPATDVGPLVNEAAADRLQAQIEESVAAGAVLLCGGARLSPRLIQPAVLTVQTADVPVMQEETFGPVAPILRVRDLDEAIAAANATPFGLSASVWTSDPCERQEFFARLVVGQLFFNAAVSSRFDLPFGGTKASGFGRELGAAGLHELVNVKTEVCADWL